MEIESHILCVKDQRKSSKSQDSRGLTKGPEKKQGRVELVFWPVQVPEQRRAPVATGTASLSVHGCPGYENPPGPEVLSLDTQEFGE